MFYRVVHCSKFFVQFGKLLGFNGCLNRRLFPFLHLFKPQIACYGANFSAFPTSYNVFMTL